MKKLLAKVQKSSWLANSSLDTRYALLEACLIGLFSALAAVMLKQGIGWLGGWRVHTANLIGGKIVLPLMGLVFGTLAGVIIQVLSPAAAGGGVPQVKAALAKYPVTLNLRTALVKTLATILVVGAGFAVGRRGPTVHIGAALGAQVSRWIPNSPTNRRQMIAAGAAAGSAPARRRVENAGRRTRGCGRRTRSARGAPRARAASARPRARARCRRP